MSLLRLAALGLALAAITAGCRRHGHAAASKMPPAGIRFERANAAAGIRFRHEDGSSGRKYFPEVMGPGCALVDLNGDGLPDIYLLNGAPLPGASGDGSYGNRLYINNGDGTFRDATEASGLRDGGYCMGVCAGDYDNDGFVDLFVTHLGRNRLYHNNGNGTFTEVAASAGVDADGFSTGATFVDVDNDGYLDLYVARYVRWDAAHDTPCYANDGSNQMRVYCRPIVYPPADALLYHNNHDGTFTEVSRQQGLRVPPGRSLGVIAADFAGKGQPSLFVANDMSANFLFTPTASQRFQEKALDAGVALSAQGRPQASMGVAVTDYDGDGRLDLACTNFSGEYLALWHNLGGGLFEDVSVRTGVAAATTRYVGFGLGFPDLDLDGWPDLFVVNGGVTEAAERFYPGASLAQPKLCLRNNTRGGFDPVAGAGPGVDLPRVSRGAAFADFDGDGRVDVLVSNWRDEPDLLRNVTNPHGHWLRLALEGTRCNRSAIGARVEVMSGGRTQVQEVRSGGSYCSQSELTLTFGLGNAPSVERVRVHWPGGGTQEWSGLSVDRLHHLRQQ